MIITNERTLVEDILKTRQKPSKMSVKNLIRYIARYYYEKYEDRNLNEYIRYVLDVVGMMDMTLLEYQEYRYAEYTRKYCKNLRNGTFPHDLREVESISITEAELGIINQAVYRKDRKVMFALYALAKIYNPELGWVNCSEADIFRFANVVVPYDEKLAILHRLYKDGLIEINHMLDKSGYHVKLVPDSPIVFSTSDLSCVGNQYLVHMNPKLRVCTVCKHVYKPQGDECVCSRCVKKGIVVNN